MDPIEDDSSASTASSVIVSAVNAAAALATPSLVDTAPYQRYAASHHHLLPLPQTSVLFHPAAVLFFTVLFSSLLKRIGKDRIVGVLSPLHANLTQRSLLQRQKQLKKDLFQAKQDLAKTSSQDEFAKWAKLRRRVDKNVADIEAINTSLSGSRASLVLLVRIGLFALATALPFVVSTYYRKTPIFWLPPAALVGLGQGHAVSNDWLGPIGWMLSLPSAPKGSISATVWSQVCVRVISLLLSAVYDLLLFVALVKDPNAPQLAATKAPGRPLVTATSVRVVWCALGLATCSFAYSKLLGLGELLGVDLSGQYGGLWQYLTNLGLVATALTLFLSLTDSLLSSTNAGHPSSTFRLKEVASMISLPGETLVFLLYWSIMLLKPELMVPSRQVEDPGNPGQFLLEPIRLPLTTDLALHGIPAVFLLVEHLLFSPSFPSSSHSSATLLTPFASTIAYCLWVERCAKVNGHFPYPLLQIMSPLARGTLYLVCSAILVGVLKAIEAVRTVMNSKLALPVQQYSSSQSQMQAQGQRQELGERRITAEAKEVGGWKGGGEKEAQVDASSEVLLADTGGAAGRGRGRGEKLDL